MKYIPLLLLLIFIVLLYFFNLHRLLSVDSLYVLKTYALNHPLLSPLLFIITYTLSVVLVVPDSLVLNLLAANLFSAPLAMIYCVLSEVAGSYLFFTIVQMATVDLSQRLHLAYLEKMQKGFLHHAPSYLLSLRISHVVPWWAINSAAACFNVRSWTFLWTTLLGVLPSTYLGIEAGIGLKEYLETGKAFSLEEIFTWQIELGLLVTSALILVPLLFQWYVKRN